MKRLHAIVRGHVQGVFFRAHTERQAVRLSVTGWVRNRRDGSVEIVAEGEESALQQLLEWARRGPPSAQVTEVISTWSQPTGEFKSFSIAGDV